MQHAGALNRIKYNESAKANGIPWRGREMGTEMNRSQFSSQRSIKIEWINDGKMDSASVAPFTDCWWRSIYISAGAVDTQNCFSHIECINYRFIEFTFSFECYHFYTAYFHFYVFLWIICRRRCWCCSLSMRLWGIEPIMLNKISTIFVQFNAHTHAYNLSFHTQIIEFTFYCIWIVASNCGHNKFNLLFSINYVVMADSAIFFSFNPRSSLPLYPLPLDSNQLMLLNGIQ